MWEEIKQSLRTAGEQLASGGTSVTTPSRTPQDIHFTNNFQQKAKSWGLSETVARDVHRNGYVIKENMMVRTDNGYQVDAMNVWL